MQAMNNKRVRNDDYEYDNDFIMNNQFSSNNNNEHPLFDYNNNNNNGISNYLLDHVHDDKCDDEDVFINIGIFGKDHKDNFVNVDVFDIKNTQSKYGINKSGLCIEMFREIALFLPLFDKINLVINTCKELRRYFVKESTFWNNCAIHMSSRYVSFLEEANIINKNVNYVKDIRCVHEYRIVERIHRNDNNMIYMNGIDKCESILIKSPTFFSNKTNIKRFELVGNSQNTMLDAFLKYIPSKELDYLKINTNENEDMGPIRYVGEHNENLYRILTSTEVGELDRLLNNSIKHLKLMGVMITEELLYVLKKNKSNNTSNNNESINKSRFDTIELGDRGSVIDSLSYNYSYETKCTKNNPSIQHTEIGTRISYSTRNVTFPRYNLSIINDIPNSENYVLHVCSGSKNFIY